MHNYLIINNCDFNIIFSVIDHLNKTILNYKMNIPTHYLVVIII